MIGYEEFLRYAPPVRPRLDHDEWFQERGYLIDDLLRVGRELAANRLAGLREGAKLSQDDLTLALVSTFLFGFEIAIRCERDEADARVSSLW